MRVSVLLLIGVALLSSCAGGGKFKTSFAPGDATSSIDGVVSIEITEIENLQSGKNKKLIVTANVRNLSDKEIRFKREDVLVELAFGGVRAKDAKLWNQELDVDVKPGESKKKIWAFEGRERVIDAGTYKGTIHNINYFEAGSLTAVGSNLEFSLEVPGQAAAAPAADADAAPEAEGGE